MYEFIKIFLWAIKKLKQQTPTITKQLKKLHNNQKNGLHAAIMEIATDPKIGDMKKVDLSGIQLYKFSMINQLTLLAYEWQSSEQKLILISLGSHENFYKKLKAARE